MRKLNFAAFLLAFALVGCSQRPMMNEDSFDTIDLGMDVSDVQKIAGKPYQVNKLTDGKEEYVYIDRIWRDIDRTDQINYVLIIEDGKVVDKNSKETQGPMDIYIHE